MKAQLEKTWKANYVFGREEATLIEGLFSSVGQVAKICVKCRGGLTLNPVSYCELLAIINSGRSQIASIGFSVPYTCGFDLAIVFSDDAYRPISFEVSGEQAEVLRINTEVEQIVEHCKTRYAFITSLCHPEVLIIISGIVGTLLVIGGLSLLQMHRTLFSLVAFVAATVAFIWRRLLTYFFPLVIFKIGKGVDSVGVYERRRSYGFGGVMLAVIAGIIAAVITQRMGF